MIKDIFEEKKTVLLLRMRIIYRIEFGVLSTIKWLSRGFFSPRQTRLFFAIKFRFFTIFAVQKQARFCRLPVQ